MMIKNQEIYIYIYINTKINHQVARLMIYGSTLTWWTSIKLNDMRINWKYNLDSKWLIKLI